MPVSITPLLADRLDISEEEARSLLDTMLQELRNEAKSDRVSLSGLGTFWVEDGSLTFSPAPSLRRRVNAQYEGLPPEDLPAEPASPEEPPASTAESEDSPDPPPFLTPKSTPEEESEDEPALETAGKDDEPDADSSSADDRDAPTPERSTPERSVDSFTVIAGILAIVFLVGAGWLVLSRTNVWAPSSSPPPQTTSEEAPEDRGGVSDPDPTDDSDADRSPEDESKESDDQEAASSTGPWTLVVTSRRSRPAAEEVADEYVGRFDSVEVVAGTVGNTTWYRVTVGRYDSQTAAERALDEHSSLLPSDAWVHRLR